MVKLFALGYSFFTIRNKKGFTLVELLVVMSITLFIGGAGLFSYVSYADRQVVEKATLDFKQALDKARANAASFVTPDACTNSTAQGGTVEGHNVTLYVDSPFLTTENLVKVDIICSNEINPRFYIPGVIVDFAPVIVSHVPLSGTCDEFFFETLTNKFSCTSGTLTSGNPAKYQFKRGAVTKNVEIDVDGFIKMN